MVVTAGGAVVAADVGSVFVEPVLEEGVLRPLSGTGRGPVEATGCAVDEEDPVSDAEV